MLVAPDCGVNPFCRATEGAKELFGGVVEGAAGNAIEMLAEAVSRSVGDGLASLGTLWVSIGTPNVTESSSAQRTAGTAPPEGLDQVLGYVLYLGLGVCVMSLMVAGARMAMPQRTGEGEETARVGTVLMATILMSGAAALVGGLFRDGRSEDASETVSMLQSSLWYYVMVLAVLSVIVAGIKMAWEQRAQPGRDLVKSLITLLLVTGAAIPVLGILIEVSDGFSGWIIRRSLSCDPTNGDGSCFRENITGLIAIGQVPGGRVQGGGVTAPFMVIVLGIVALLVSLVQIMLMVARAGMLVILAGVLPLTAAATNTEMGHLWFKRAVSWLVAWLLYKPAAAIVYATAFHLTGTSLFRDDGTGLIKVVTGLMLMLMAIVALPALMRFVTPAVSSMASGGGGGGMALAAAASPAMGAVSTVLRSRTGAGGTHSPSPSPDPAQGAESGGSGLDGSGSPSGDVGSGGSGGGSVPGAGTGSAEAGSAGSGSLGAGASAGSAGASSAAAGGGAAAGMAGGPAGLAVMAVADGAKKGMTAAKSVAEGAANTEGESK